jgi:hypothetical protein
VRQEPAQPAKPVVPPARRPEPHTPQGSQTAGAFRSGPIGVPRWVYLLVTLAALLLGIEAIVRGTRAVVSVADSDLTNFFFPSADYILRGQPWQLYAVRASGGYPNYNPPLSIFLMAPLLGLARAIGFDRNYGELITFVSLPFILFIPLLGWLVLRALRLLYPQAPETLRLLAYVLIALSPLTWQSIGTWYHIEQPMMLCFLVAALLALQARREGVAGALAGLALLSRTTALMPLLALGVLLVAGREWRGLLRFAGVAGAVVAASLAPFFVLDRADATYAFLTWRGTAIIGGNSIWSIFAAGGAASGVRHTLDAVARRLDMPSVVLFIIAAAFLAARRFRISAYSRDAWAVLAIAALAVPMLSKTNWPYYYLEPFILLLVWEFASMHDRIAGVWRWPVLTLSYLAVATTLSQYLGLQSVGALDRISLGLLEFGAMASFVAAIWLRLRTAKPTAVSGASPPAGMPMMASPQGAAAGMGNAPADWRSGMPGGGAPEPPPRLQGAAQAPAPAMPVQAPRPAPPPSPGGAWPGGMRTPPQPQGPGALSGAGAEGRPDSTMPGRRLPDGAPPWAGPPPNAVPGGARPPAGQWPDLDDAWPGRPPAMGDR